VSESAPEISDDPPPSDVPSGTVAPVNGPTRISAAWVATGVALVLLILLLIFILQNLQQVRLHYLGFSPKMPLGVAMLLAAVVGGVVVGVTGGLRVIQIHRSGSPRRRTRPGP
jgi:uncharacterized integral membrane protein